MFENENSLEKSSWWFAAYCSNCNEKFKSKKAHKGLFRISVENSLPPSNESARETLSKLIGTQFVTVSNKSKGQFLCPECWSRLREIAKYQWSLDQFLDRTHCKSYIGQMRTESSGTCEEPPKRPRFSNSQTAKRSRKRICIPVTAKWPTKWETIINAVKSRHYGRAVKLLYEATKGSQRQFIHCVCRIIRKEVIKLLQDDTAFQLCKTVDISSIDRFSWDDTLDKLQTHAPLLSAVLHRVVSSKFRDSTLQKRDIPKLGTAVACLLHARAPRKAAFIPTVFSIQFWKGGLKRETIDQLYRTGICLTTEKTLDILDKIRRDPKTNEIVKQPVAVKKKKQLEVQTAMRATDISIEGKSNARSDEEETILYSDDERMDIENICPKSNDDIESDDSNDDEGDAGDEDEDDDDDFHGDEDDNIGDDNDHHLNFHHHHDESDDEDENDNGNDDGGDDESDIQIAVGIGRDTAFKPFVSVFKEQKSNKIETLLEPAVSISKEQKRKKIETAFEPAVSVSKEQKRKKIETALEPAVSVSKEQKRKKIETALEPAVSVSKEQKRKKIETALERAVSVSKEQKRKKIENALEPAVSVSKEQKRKKIETALEPAVSVSKEQQSKKQVEKNFEAGIPEDVDFHGMKTLLQQVFLKANIDISELTDTIISQNYVGSIVKPYIADNDEDDAGDSDDAVLALTTAINITERKDLSCVKQMKGMLLEKCQKCSKEQFEKFNKLLSDPDQHVGYLVSERFLNLPPNMALSLYESLIKGLKKACQKDMEFSFQYFLMICKTFLIKSSEAKKEMFFSNSEEEFFQEVGEVCFSYSVAHEGDSRVEKWSSEDDMEPYRTVIVFPADKLPIIVDRIKQERAESVT